MIDQEEIAGRLRSFFKCDVAFSMEMQLDEEMNQPFFLFEAKMDEVEIAKVGIYVKDIRDALEDGIDVTTDIYEMLRKGLMPHYMRKKWWKGFRNPSLN